MLLDCGKYSFTLIDNGADGSFTIVTTQTVFVPPMSPNINHQWETCLLDCRLEQSSPKSQRYFPTTDFIKKNKKQKKDTPDCKNLRRDGRLCFESCVMSMVNTMFKETKFSTNYLSTQSRWRRCLSRSSRINWIPCKMCYWGPGGSILMIIPESAWLPLKMQYRQDIFCIKFS